MRLSLALKEKLFDIRLLDKLLAEGKLSREELESHLEKLEDLSDRSLFTESRIDQNRSV
jgi:hypothetical protein